MEIADLLSPEAVVPHLKVASKKQALQELARHAAALAGLPERRIYETLSEREKLGSTGMGQGIAIPHGRVQGIEKMTGLFARLDHPVDFGAMDDQPVDLVFLLLLPGAAEGEQLNVLASVARRLRDPSIAANVRGTRDGAEAYAAIAAG